MSTAQTFSAAGSLAGDRSSGDRRAQSQMDVCLTDARAEAGGGMFLNPIGQRSAIYIQEIRRNVRRMTRRELRRLMTIHHGQRIPKDANLRNYVSKFHAHQQAINAGGTPSPFWCAAAGVPNDKSSKHYG